MVKTFKEEVEKIQKIIHQFISFEIGIHPKKDIYEILNQLKISKNNFEIYNLMENFIQEALKNMKATEKVLNSKALSLFLNFLTDNDEKLVNLSILSLSSLIYQNSSIALILIQNKIIPSIILKENSKVVSIFFTCFLIHSNLYNEFKRLNLYEKNSKEIYSNDYTLTLFNVISMYLMSYYDHTNQNLSVDFQFVIESLNQYLNSLLMKVR
jgi:hypothetical protein